MQSVTQDGRSVELFMEYPLLVQGEGAKFNVHLTVLADGMPVRQGKLTVVAKGPSGKTVTAVQESPRSPGIYGPVLAFLESGSHELNLSLESKQARDTLRLSVMVYPSRARAEKAGEAKEEEPSAGTITFQKEQGWKIGVVHRQVSTRRLVERLRVPGAITPAAGAEAVVTPTVAGRLLPPPRGRFPRIGERVSAGQVVAVIEPPLTGSEGAAMLANRAQLQTFETELGVKVKEAEIEIGKAKIDLDYARKAREQLSAASRSGSVPEATLRQAERQFKLAEAAYQGKLKVRDLYEQARKDAASVFPAVNTASGTGKSKNRTSSSQPPSSRVQLRSPLTGTVTASRATAGEFVKSSRSVFTVIDLERVWVEASVSEADVGKVLKAPAALFTLPAYPGRHFTILGTGGGKLVNVGSVINTASRTLPLRYEVPNPQRLLRVGMSAEVAIETARTRQTVAIPESAIVDEDGRPTAYVRVDGEHFQKRDLQLGIRDSGYVEVRSGLKEGEYVVTKGAYAIRLASVSAVIPAHGHTH
jgi:RND family efflux transporter MFP subunit